MWPSRCLGAFGGCCLHVHPPPVCCWHSESSIYICIHMAKNTEAAPMAYCLTFASGLKKSRIIGGTGWVWVNSQNGDALNSSKRKKKKINCRCHRGKVKHIHQGKLIKRNYCNFGPPESKFTFMRASSSN